MRRATGGGSGKQLLHKRMVVMRGRNTSKVAKYPKWPQMPWPPIFRGIGPGETALDAKSDLSYERVASAFVLKLGTTVGPPCSPIR